MMAADRGPSSNWEIRKRPAKRKADNDIRGRPISARVTLPYLSVHRNVKRPKEKFTAPKRRASSSDLCSGIPSFSRVFEKNACNLSQ